MIKYKSSYEKTCIDFHSALADYLQEDWIADPKRDPTELAICLSMIIAADATSLDQDATEKKDRIIRAYLGRVTAILNRHASLAKRLNERRRERERAAR